MNVLRDFDYNLYDIAGNFTPWIVRCNDTEKCFAARDCVIKTCAPEFDGEPSEICKGYSGACTD